MTVTVYQVAGIKYQDGHAGTGVGHPLLKPAKGYEMLRYAQDDRLPHTQRFYLTSNISHLNTQYSFPTSHI